jgi:benzoyl-CoA reductase/2-hydroxyglutaryl-CoA dehydratase subunit BcrC/BadD/HgdB
MYFVRINSNNINPLIKESLNVNKKKMHDEGKYSWYTCLNNIFKEFDLDIEDYSNIDKPFHRLQFPLSNSSKR